MVTCSSAAAVVASSSILRCSFTCGNTATVSFTAAVSTDNDYAVTRGSSLSWSVELPLSEGLPVLCHFASWSKNSCQLRGGREPWPLAVSSALSAIYL